MYLRASALRSNTACRFMPSYCKVEQHYQSSHCWRCTCTELISCKIASRSGQGKQEHRTKAMADCCCAPCSCRDPSWGAAILLADSHATISGASDHQLALQTARNVSLSCFAQENGQVLQQGRLARADQSASPCKPSARTVHPMGQSRNRLHDFNKPWHQLPRTHAPQDPRPTMQSNLGARMQ